MGTRNLVAVFYQGKYSIAQYGQWDGYPEGNGLEVLEFVRKLSDTKSLMGVFKDNLGKLTWIKEDELKQTWVECGADPNESGVSMDVSNAHTHKYPHLSRDTGAGILNLVLTMKDTEPLKLKNSLDFAGDGLYCEWAWVLDLDKNTLECYDGWHQEPIPETDRFAYLGKQHYDGCKEDYYPVKLVVSFPLEKLPTNDEFLAAFEKESEEDEE